CGGMWGWEELLETVNDPKHERYEELREWLGLEPGERFDGETFDVGEADAELAELWEGAKEKGGGRRPKAGGRGRKELEGLRALTYDIVTEPLADPAVDLPPEIRGQEWELH